MQEMYLPTLLPGESVINNLDCNAAKQLDPPTVLTSTCGMICKGLSPVKCFLSPVAQHHQALFSYATVTAKTLYLFYLSTKRFGGSILQ